MILNLFLLVRTQNGSFHFVKYLIKSNKASLLLHIYSKYMKSYIHPQIYKQIFVVALSTTTKKGKTNYPS